MAGIYRGGRQVAACFGRYDRERNDREGWPGAVGVFLAEDCLILLILCFRAFFREITLLLIVYTDDCDSKAL